MKLNEHLSIKNFLKIIFENEKLELDESLINRVEESFQFLKDFSKEKLRSP